MSQPSPQSRPAGIHLFTVAGIRVSLHWLWFVIAFYEISSRRTAYTSVLWNAAEYVTLFLIVLLHEFGHAFACRSVGGRADHIMLWPLGGVAFVQPPQRPGAVLWSIVAGPLVNLALAPLLWYAAKNAGAFGWPADVRQLVRTVHFINLGLLIFNLLPVYPLDGGQILRALLWYVIGAARSLLVASIIGVAGALIGFAVLFFLIRDTEARIWLALIVGFAITQSWQGIKQARMTAWLTSRPRHVDRHCPSCKQPPPAVPMWACRCGTGVDPFPTNGVCPACGTRFALVPCPFCSCAASIDQWRGKPTSTPIEPPAIPVTASSATASTTESRPPA